MEKSSLDYREKLYSQIQEEYGLLSDCRQSPAFAGFCYC